jgi:hypothetical protein
VRFFILRRHLVLGTCFQTRVLLVSRTFMQFVVHLYLHPSKKFSLVCCGFGFKELILTAICRFRVHFIFQAAIHSKTACERKTTPLISWKALWTRILCGNQRRTFQPTTLIRRCTGWVQVSVAFTVFVHRSESTWYRLCSKAGWDWLRD